MAALKTTLLTPYHIELGAKMIPSYGWNIPLHYPNGSTEEHQHTRKHCSLFDCCSSGKIRLNGPPDKLDRLFTLPLPPISQAAHNLLLDEEGGILDRVLVCRMAEDDLLLVSSPGGISLLLNHLKKTTDAADLSTLLADLKLIGPDSAEALRCAFDLAELPASGEIRTLELDQIRTIVIAEKESFTLLFNLEVVDQLWDILLETEPIQPAGAGAFESLRVEDEIPAFGCEFTRDFTPRDAGLQMMLRSEGDFTGKTASEKRPQRKASGKAILAGRRAARQGTRITDAAGETIGVVTTGAFCPDLNAAAALCSFEAGSVPAPGTEIFFEAGDARLPGTMIP